jgi:hypothetical protein
MGKVLACATVEVTVEAPTAYLHSLTVAQYLTDLGHACRLPALGAVVVDWDWSDDPACRETIHAVFAVVLHIEGDAAASVYPDCVRVADVYPGAIISTAYGCFPDGKDLVHASGCRVTDKTTGYVVG